ncbi:SDR family NAD(P)-dependent oxidoreductase [Streptomyces sp. NPDC096105]|uniref:SDR family NAD(P)-dependent oxidoreductase n=1 Tax=Streptomyces sp. NPDC096105 TaxID=3366074 RepID=UPI00381D1C83
MDVTDRRAVSDAVEQAAAVFGRLDVVVNNAGAMLYGMVEAFPDERVSAETDDLVRYEEMFSRFEGAAVFGGEARDLLMRVMALFSRSSSTRRRT